MSFSEALVLGIVQGLTEFLPISSSGHLALAESLMGRRPDVGFIVYLHLASLAAVCAYYRRRLLELATVRRRELAYLVLATMPIVLVGFFLRKPIEAAFDRPALICALLVANGIFLWASERFARDRQPLAEAPWWKALLIGVAQGIRLPGLSRSGSTIGAGFLCGIRKDDCVRFSFLLSIPAILGATAVKAKDAMETPPPWGPLAIAVAVTFALSVASIRIVETLAARRRFLVFAVYCVVAGVVGLVLFVA